MMRNLRTLLALLLALLMTCSIALADAPLLRHANGWSLEGMPLDVYLTADVTTHMPFDDERFAMLKALLDEMSLHIQVGGNEEGSVTIGVGNSDALTLRYSGNEAQLSTMPEFTFHAGSDPMGKLLGSPVESEISLYGIDAKGEEMLTDGWELLNALIPALEDAEYGQRKKNTTSIKDMGKAGYILNATVPAKDAENLRDTLLRLCPEGRLHDILRGLAFTGKQTFRIYQTAGGVPLRVEYNGSCGPEGAQHTVQLIWRTRRDDTAYRDDLTLTAKDGSDKISLTYERVTQTSKKGVITTEGEFSYVVKKDGKTLTRESEFELKNSPTEASDVLTGKLIIKKKEHGESKFESLTFEPNVTISGTEAEPSFSGSIAVTGKYDKDVTESATIHVTASTGTPISWSETISAIDLDTLTEEELLRFQADASASIASAIVRPLMILLGQDADWFFRDMSDEAVKNILDAANSTVVIN